MTFHGTILSGLLELMSPFRREYVVAQKKERGGGTRKE